MITKFKIFENNISKSVLDYTYLKEHTTVDELNKVCKDVIENNVYGLVVYDDNIATVVGFLDDSDVKVVSAINFPVNGKKTKKASISYLSNKIMDAVTSGADEVDVIFDYKKLKNLSILKDDEYNDEYNDILDGVQTLVRLSHSNGRIIKLVIEIEELTYEQIKIACDICEKAGTDFIQTSSGYSKKKPDWKEKKEKIKFMRKILPDYINIKVSGGIRNKAQIDELLNIGVDRIGTSVFL